MFFKYEDEEMTSLLLTTSLLAPSPSLQSLPGQLCSIRVAVRLQALVEESNTTETDDVTSDDNTPGVAADIGSCCEREESRSRSRSQCLVSQLRLHWME